ncbi:hypothetical protein ACFY2V_19880 [Streptomyces eurythermus]
MSAQRPSWSEPSYSSGEGGQCLELATRLTVTPETWSAVLPGEKERLRG